MGKQPKTVDEQIALLQDRNMIIKDKDVAKHFLSNISYYRLKGYWWEMQSDKIEHIFHEGSVFETVIDYYNFDRHFRLILFNAIERIEIALRTKLIYHLSLAHGENWYMECSIFDRFKTQSQLIAKILNDSAFCKEEFMLKHFENHPNEYPEAWKALEVLSLGTLSKIYNNLHHQLPEKNIIAKEFGLFNGKYLESWLLAITFVRNIIAHHGRLYNRVIITKYDWPKTSKEPILDYSPSHHQRRKIFPLLCGILYLNDFASPGHHLRNEIFNLFDMFPNIEIKKLGFPNGWQEQPIWQIKNQ